MTSVAGGAAEADVVKKVLFLSSANSVRSQMAEAFLRALADDAFEAYSAGSVPRDIDPTAVAVMAELGVHIGDQRPKGMQEYMGTAQFDHLITVCDRDEKDCPMFPGKGTREYWPLADPARDFTDEVGDEARLAAFREARDHIETRVRRWLVEHRYKAVRELRAEDATADR
jgi:arsenate reductase